MHISELIRMQFVGASFCFCLKNHPRHYFHTLGWRGFSRWRISPVPIALWILLSAAQKQGRPHSGTETQILPRLLQLENEKKSKWTGFNIQERSVSVHSRNNSAPLTFDRSSILRSRIVRSLFPALGCCRSEDEGRSGLDENCLDTQQEKHDTGLAESYPNPKETALSGHPSIWQFVIKCPKKDNLKWNTLANRNLYEFFKKGVWWWAKSAAPPQWLIITDQTGFNDHIPPTGCEFWCIFKQHFFAI